MMHLFRYFPLGRLELRRFGGGGEQAQELSRSSRDGRMRVNQYRVNRHSQRPGVTQVSGGRRVNAWSAGKATEGCGSVPQVVGGASEPAERARLPGRRRPCLFSRLTDSAPITMDFGVR